MKTVKVLAITVIVILATSCGSKIDHSSPESIIMSFFKALDEGNIYNQVKCYDLQTNKYFKHLTEEALAEMLTERMDSDAARDDGIGDVGHYKDFKVTDSIRMGSDSYRVDFEYYDPILASNRIGMALVYQVDGLWYIEGSWSNRKK